MVTHNTWFGGVYQDPKNFFAQIAVEPEKFMAIYKEYKLPPEQMKAWLEDRQGVIVGKDLAERFGWKLGDRVPIQATIWQPKSGRHDLGIQRGRHLRRRRRASTRRSSSSATTTWTRTARRARAWSAGTS